jgi:cytoskeletal protein CcmA (bactofilin family)/anti-sigma factor RsiW
MNHSDGHFDEMTGLLYLEGQLDASRASEVATHLGSCAACREIVHALETEGVWLREALAAEDESIPASVVAAPERGAAHWGWIAAFGLGIGGAYTLWNGFIEPSLAQASQAGFTQGNLLTMLFFTGAFWKGWDAMRSLTEFMAVATLGTVALWLLRKQLQRFTAIAFVAGALAIGLAQPQPVAAADVQHGNPAYTLPAGQEVKTDLIVAADRTRIDGDVDGDLIVFSNSLTVNGHVKGDILAFGAEVRVNGPVDGNVRVWCQSFNLDSAVAKNAMAWTGASEFDEKSSVAGTLTMFSGSTILNGKIAGDLLAYVGDLTIGGSLGHDVTVRGGRLNVGPNAEIVGRTKFTGDREPEVSPGAKLGSPVQFTMVKHGPNYSRPRYYWHQVMFWGASFVLGLAILLLAPGFFFDTEQMCKKIGPAIGFGALFLFATPIAAGIVCATIVGLSVGIPALLFYGVALYAAKIFVGAWLGEKLLGAGLGIGPALGRLALGLAILRLLGMLPYAGFWVGLLTVMWGLGALVLALHRRISPTVAAAA